MTDEEILKNLKLTGKIQEKALENLYKTKGREFGRFFISRGLDQFEAEDVVQETVLKILKNVNLFRGDGSVNSWMWQIARNSYADFLRKKKQEKAKNLNEDEWEIAEKKSSTLQVGEIDDTSRKAEECVTNGLKRFSDEDPERAYAIELVVEGVDGKEIAQRIGRTYDATRQFLTQCRHHFAPYIEECLPLLMA